MFGCLFQIASSREGVVHHPIGCVHRHAAVTALIAKSHLQSHNCKVKQSLTHEVLKALRSHGLTVTRESLML